MAHAKRVRHSPVIKFNGSNEAPTFRVKVLEAFQSLLALGADEESAWSQAGPIAKNLIRQGCPIASRIDGDYDGDPMNGTATKSKNGKAKGPVEAEPFHIVVSRGIDRFVTQQELSIPKAAEKYGIHPRKLDRLIKSPTPGLIGENFDKICQAFGIARQDLLALGEPQP